MPANPIAMAQSMSFDPRWRGARRGGERIQRLEGGAAGIDGELMVDRRTGGESCQAELSPEPS
jgi:hypothetical protein